MSDEFGADALGRAESDGESISPPEVEAPKPSASEGEASSSAAPRLRRLVRIGAGAAVIAVVALIAAVASMAAPSSPRPLLYTKLPAGCTLVRVATLAKYAPTAEGRPYGGAPSSTDHFTGCAWFTSMADEGVSLYVSAEVYGSSDWLDTAKRNYDAWAYGRYRGYEMTARSVPGLGDQATNLFVTRTSGKVGGTGPWTVPEILLVVRSRNAVIMVNYIVVAGQNPPPKPSDAALEAAAIAMARDVLAVLSH